MSTYADDRRYHRESTADCPGAVEDPHTYDHLTGRILAAPTPEALLALVPALVAFEGDAFRLEFGESWSERWFELAGNRPVPPDAWPPLREP